MISIIANFYNSGRYIDKLIRSVLSQTYSDWELVCVNDCSPGNDKQMLEAYAARDSRIRVIDNAVNLGIARAKKAGIDNANGEYITFIDGDDWLAPETLERMYRAITEYDVDVVAMHSCKIIAGLGYKIETDMVSRQISTIGL